jgi:hypothetical protein
MDDGRTCIKQAAISSITLDYSLRFRRWLLASLGYLIK